MMRDATTHRFAAAPASPHALAGHAAMRAAPARGAGPFGPLARACAKVRHSGLGPWHYLIFLLALLTTVAAYAFSAHQSALRALDHFDREAAQLTGLIAERMATYEDALRAAVAAMELRADALDAQSWRAFERALDTVGRYPGINGIGVIFHVPAAELDAFVEAQQQDRPAFRVHPAVPGGSDHYPITFIEPEAQNHQAIGLDIAFESARRDALTAAAQSATTRMTAPIALVQDDRSSPGFLIFMPFYDSARAPPDRADATSTTAPGATPRLVPLSGEDFAGAVYAPFIMDRLMEGTLGREFRTVLIDISDGADALYTESAGASAARDPVPMFARTQTLDMFGRTWTIALQTTTEFRALNGTAAPTLVLVFGLIVEAALLALFLGLGRANRRGIRLAGQLTEALQIEKRELEASNLALERYNYLSSHDLRTPLRGMHDVACDLGGDLAGLFPGGAVPPEVSGHLDDLNRLIVDMDTLIGGMVAYAQIGHARERRSILDTGSELVALVRAQAASGATILLTGDCPHIECNRDLFRLIAGHLITNAVQHHPRPGAARIGIECRAVGHNLILQVQDDGDGIPRHLHGQLFDRLRRPDDANGPARAGLGLAMVKRAVSAIGGYVTVTSGNGAGSSFTVVLLDVLSPGIPAGTGGMAAAAGSRAAGSGGGSETATTARAPQGRVGTPDRDVA